MGVVGIGWGHEKNYQQLAGRHGIGFIRELLACYRRGEVTAEGVAAELGITARRVWQLYGDYLEACAAGRDTCWAPGISGGNRARQIPVEVEALWCRMLKVRPPAAYGFAASEALRRHGFHADRATVRRWAFQKGLAHAKPARKEKSPFRWQCQQIGMLWQLDMTPHQWFPGAGGNLPLLDFIDDCSRVMTGT